MEAHDPVKELLHTLKVAILFFTIAAVVFALHAVCEYLEAHHFSSFYVVPLKILEYMAFVGDILYLTNHLLGKIIDGIFAFGDTYKKSKQQWRTFKRPEGDDRPA